MWDRDTVNIRILVFIIVFIYYLPIIYLLNSNKNNYFAGIAYTAGILLY